MSEEYTPFYYDVDTVPKSVDASVGYIIHTIEPANNNQAGLNAGQELNFTYAGGKKVIRLHPRRSGFRVKAAFRTKTFRAADAAANPVIHAGFVNDRNANITLSSGWFWHLFDSFKLGVANNDTVETLTYPGVYADTRALFKGSEYKNIYGNFVAIFLMKEMVKQMLYPILVRLVLLLKPILHLLQQQEQLIL